MKTKSLFRGVYPIFPILLIGLLFSFKVLATNQMLFRLVAQGQNMQYETVVYFDSAATVYYDPMYDAPSLGVDPGELDIVTYLNGTEYQINALPPLSQSISLPVRITTGVTGTYAVYAGELQNLPQAAQIVLFDTYTNTSFDLRSGAFSCLVTDTETVARFVLTITTSQLLNATGGSLPPACTASADGYLFASGPGNGPYNYYWKDSLNNVIQIDLNKTGADTLLHANAGHYRVDINTPGTFDNASLYFNLQGTQSARAHFTIPNNQLVLSNNSADANFTNTSENGESYWWDFGDGMGSNDEHGSNSYSQLGTYTVTLTVYNSACPETSVYSDVITVTGGTTELVTHPTGYLAIGYDENGYFISQAEGKLRSVTVFDLTGRMVAQKQAATGGDSKLYLGSDMGSEQVYILQARLLNNTMMSVKFIK